MKKSQFGLILIVVLLAGCDHHKPANQAQSEAGSATVARSDSDLTGQPTEETSSSNKTSPQEKPVSAPVESESSKLDSSPGAVSEAASMPATNTPASTPPTDSPPVVISTLPPSDSQASRKETEQEQVVVLRTSFGRIIIKLDDTAAPKTCENFRKLVSNGFYNHTTFHRVIPNFMIQGGDPNSKSNDRANDGQGGPGYTLSPEIGLKHDRGAVAMARLPDSVNPQRESNGSQFYICVAPCPSLDDQYTVFGHVIKGMDAAVKIAEQSRDKRDDPLNRIEIEASLESKDKALAESPAVNP